MMGFSPTELIVVAVIVVLLFGARKIPEIFRGLGTGLREFKESLNEVKQETHQAVRNAPPPETSSEAPKQEAPQKDAPTT